MSAEVTPNEVPPNGTPLPPMPPPPHAPIGPDGKALRICCSCPETKTVRDECVLFKGQDGCTKEIDLHKECLRALGFKI